MLDGLAVDTTSHDLAWSRLPPRNEQDDRVASLAGPDVTEFTPDKTKQMFERPTNSLYSK